MTVPVLVVVNSVDNTIKSIQTEPSGARVAAFFAQEETKQPHYIFNGTLEVSTERWEDKG